MTGNISKNIMITLSENDWFAIKAKLEVEWAHKPSVFMIRYVMKRELGFTVRQGIEVWSATRKVTSYYLDFFDEPTETMFRLRYL